MKEILCKTGRNDCEIDESSKSCSACRYKKCLSIGMRPELVLDDDEKKTRFRKFLLKKASVSPSSSSSGTQRRRGQKRRSSGDDVDQYVEVKTEVDTESGYQLYPSNNSNSSSNSVFHDRRIQQEMLWLRLGQQEPVHEEFVKKEIIDDVINNRDTSRLEVLADIAPDELRQYLTAPHTPGAAPSTSSVIYNSVINNGGNMNNTTHINNSIISNSGNMSSGVIRTKEEVRDTPPQDVRDWSSVQSSQQSETPAVAPQPQRKSVIVRAGRQQ